MTRCSSSRRCGRRGIVRRLRLLVDRRRRRLRRVVGPSRRRRAVELLASLLTRGLLKSAPELVDVVRGIERPRIAHHDLVPVGAPVELHAIARRRRHHPHMEVVGQPVDDGVAGVQPLLGIARDLLAPDPLGQAHRLELGPGEPVDVHDELVGGSPFGLRVGEQTHPEIVELLRVWLARGHGRRGAGESASLLRSGSRILARSAALVARLARFIRGGRRGGRGLLLRRGLRRERRRRFHGDVSAPVFLHGLHVELARRHRLLPGSALFSSKSSPSGSKRSSRARERLP